MRITNVKINKKKYELASPLNPSYNYFSILVGKNGTGKSETLKNIIAQMIRCRLNKSNSPYRDSLDEYLDNNYKDISNRNPSNLSFYIDGIHHKVNFSTHYSKTNESREFVNYLGDVELLDENNYRYDSKFYKNTSESLLDFEVNDYLSDVNIIPVSCCPFDKFPIPQVKRFWSESIFNYHYFDVNGFMSDISYSELKDKNKLSKKIELLCLAIVKSIYERKKVNYKRVLKFINHSPTCKIYYTLSEYGSTWMSDWESETRYTSRLRSSIGYNRLKGSRDEFNKAKKIYNEYKTTSTYEFQGYSINSLEGKDSLTIDLVNPFESYKLIEDIALLSKYGFLKFHDIEFQNKNTSLFTQASSGQLCILLMIFGITANIQDNSLILLDEPELSLHPKWQGEILNFIKSLFYKYKGCHFIIATHSPQIASGLNTEMARVIKLDSGESLDLKTSSNKSADYQLAKVFNAPGPSNEYISSELIKILTSISQNGGIDDELNLRVFNINKCRRQVSKSDPVNRLYVLLDVATEHYT